MPTTSRRVRPKNGDGCLPLLLILVAWLVPSAAALPDNWPAVPRAMAQWAVLPVAVYFAGQRV